MTVPRRRPTRSSTGAGCTPRACATSPARRTSSARDFPAVRIAELAELRRRTQAAFDDAGLLVRLHAGGELSHVDAAWLGEDDLEA